MPPAPLSPERYRAKVKSEPQWFLQGAMAEKPWSKQLEIISSLRDHRRTAVKGCVGSTKTRCAAQATYWFLNAYFPAKVYHIAPTFRQVELNIWGEMHALYHQAKIPVGGKLLETELKLSKILYAIGMSTNDPNNIQGIHGPNVLVIVDEAQGMSHDIFPAIENIMAGGNTRILYLMNPSVVAGEAFDAFHSKAAMYNQITISAFDVPNVITGQNIIPGAITKSQVEEWIKVYGKDSAFCQVKVFAQFPRQERDSLIPLDWIELAMVRETPLPECARVYGADIARFGSDLTSLCPLWGRRVLPIQVWQGKDLMETTGRIKIELDDNDGSCAGIDVIGLGGGVVDRLSELGMDIEGISSAEVSDDPDNFPNLRSQMAWQVREALDPSNPEAISLPKDNELVAQLSSIKYKIDSKGRRVIESKDDIRKRLGKSPDRFDSLALAIHKARGGQSGHDPIQFGADVEIDAEPQGVSILL